jgi:predicted dehydrogenase
VHVGLVGCGRWGRHVLRDLRALGCKVTVVARGDGSARAAADGHADAIVRTLAELPEVAGVVVVTPTTTHAEVLEPLLELDVPIYCEKPLTDDPATAEALVRSALDRLFVMHKWRYHDGIRELARIARSGELGRVEGLRSTRVGWGNPHGDVDGVWMLAPHDLSIALEILGEIPTPRAAAAERSGGVVTGLVGLLGEDPWFGIDVSIAHGIRRREVRLICEGGVAVLGDSYAAEVLVLRGQLQGDVSREEVHRPVSDEMPLLGELRAFIEHLRGGPPPLSSAAEGLAEVQAIGRLRELAGLQPGS